MPSERIKVKVRRTALALGQVVPLSLALLSYQLWWSLAAFAVRDEMPIYVVLWRASYFTLFIAGAAGVAAAIWYTRLVFAGAFCACVTASLNCFLGLALGGLVIPALIWSLVSVLYCTAMFRCAPSAISAGRST